MRNLGKVINNKDIATKEYVDNHGGESLPIGSEIDYDGNDIPTGWEEVDDPNIYSTTEKRVGTWIDGSGLYKKTYVFTSAITIRANTWTTIATDANIQTIIQNYNIFDYGISGSYLCRIDNNNIQIYIKNNELLLKAAVITYTKITD